MGQVTTIPWATIENGSGTGAAKNSVVVTDKNNGRNIRYGLATTHIGSKIGYTQIIQKGRPSFIEMDHIVGPISNAITLVGYSNASQINVKYEKDVEYDEAMYTLNEEDYEEFEIGKPITSDPGATAQYMFEIYFVLPEATSTKDRKFLFVFSDNEGNEVEVEVTQEGISSSISVSPSTLNFTSDAKALKTVQVTSNERYSINGKTGSVKIGHFAIEFSGDGSETITVRTIEQNTTSTTITSTATLTTVGGATATLTMNQEGISQS